MTYVLYICYLEEIMKRAALAGLLLFAAVFMIGILFGWPYAMMIGCLLIGLTMLVSRRQ